MAKRSAPELRKLEIPAEQGPIPYAPICGKIAVVACLHGDEPYGLEILKKLPDKIKKIIGNPKALKSKTRFICKDLNRIFPGRKSKCYEETRATEILKEIKDMEYVIDLHSSSTNIPLFGIITKPNPEKFELARKMGLKRLVIMPEFFASGKSLIDFAKCGISLEIGPHSHKKNVKEVAEKLNNFIKEKNTKGKLEVFEIFGKIDGDKDSKMLMKNFKKVKRGSVIAKGKEKYFALENFFPIFVGENSYAGILCLMARRLDFINNKRLISK